MNVSEEKHDVLMKRIYSSPKALTVEALMRIPLLSGSGQGSIPDTPNDNDYDFVALPDFIFDDFSLLL